MTTAPDVAVVATQLARTDRRALSQAWYSALHLVHDEPARRALAAAQAPAGPPSRRALARTSPDASAAAGGRRGAPAPRAALAGAVAPLPFERRGAVTEAGRRVERAVATIARSPHPRTSRTSRTLALDGGRVTLLVRTDADATRIVALCSVPLRPTVERALAQARYVLAARGTTVAAR
jgi:hypothetical protein